ncbi:TPA: hypothetical protein QDB28_005670 [Burkholderia vietnamiensis]|nr:hypothetical protein [Burkholderia vietnamiensis]
MEVVAKHFEVLSGAVEYSSRERAKNLTVVHAEPLPRPLVRSKSTFVPTDAHKRMYKILGTNWVGHPDYQPNPRHSFNPDIYAPAREQFLSLIVHRARADRERNPAFHRAAAIRAVI